MLRFMAVGVVARLDDRSLAQDHSAPKGGCLCALWDELHACVLLQQGRWTGEPSLLVSDALVLLVGMRGATRAFAKYFRGD